MRNIVLTTLLTFLALSLFVSAQQPSDAAAREQEISARIGALVDRLNYRDDDQADKDRYYDELDNVTRELQAWVDDYVRRAIPGSTSSPQIEAILNRLLRRQPNPLYGNGPLALKADLRAGKSLLLGYTVVRAASRSRDDSWICRDSGRLQTGRSDRR
jgi:hypothetical protein